MKKLGENLEKNLEKTMKKLGENYEKTWRKL
jgi:hypothetical protein